MQGFLEKVTLNPEPWGLDGNWSCIQKFRAQMDAGVWAKPWSRAKTVRAQESERGRGNSSINIVPMLEDHEEKSMTKAV